MGTRGWLIVLAMSVAVTLAVSAVLIWIYS